MARVLSKHAGDKAEIMKVERVAHAPGPSVS